MTNLEPQPQEPKFPVDPELLREVCLDSDRLLAGIVSDTDVYPPDVAGEDYMVAVKEAYFPFNRGSSGGEVWVKQAVDNLEINTEVHLITQDPELSIGGYEVHVFNNLEVTQEHSGKLLNAHFDVRREVSEKGSHLTGVVDPDKNSSKEELKVYNLDWDKIKEKMHQRLIEKEALRRIDPKSSDQRVQEMLDILKILDIANRTIEIGTEDVRDIDLRN